MLRKIAIGFIGVLALVVGAAGIYLATSGLSPKLAAEEFAAERLLGYDLEPYTDENGETQFRAVDGPVVWRIDYDESLFDGLALPGDGWFVVDADDEALEEFGFFRGRVIAETESDRDVGAAAWTDVLIADGWTVTSEDEVRDRLQLSFARGASSLDLSVGIEPAFDTVSISFTYKADATQLSWLAHPIPVPAGGTLSYDSGADWYYNAPGGDTAAGMEAYAALLADAGWETGEPEDLGRGGTYKLTFRAERQIGVVEAFSGLIDGIEQVRYHITVTRI